MKTAIQTGILILICTILICGCSGAGDSSNPVMPDENISQPGLTGEVEERETTNENGHYLLLYNLIYVDPDNPDGPIVEVVPIRAGELHLNILKFLEVGPCTDCFKIVGFNFPEPGILDVDIEITHPFDDLIFTVFDVRGIMMFNASHEFPASGLTMSDSNLGDGELLNAEGYTQLYNGSTLGAAGDFFTYFKGKFATETVPDADLNGFIRHITDDPANTRNALYPEDSVTQTYSLGLPSGEFVLGYAVDASWDIPDVDPVIDPMTDFPVTANCIEPWKVEITEEPVGVGLTDLGGETKLILDVYDWQGKGSHAEPVIECPELFDGSVEAAWVADYSNYSQWAVIVSNSIYSLPGSYRCLISAEDKSNDPVGKPWLDLTAYQIFDVGVSSVGTVSEVEPNNLIEQATLLPTGKKGLGVLTAPTDQNDWWKFEVSADSKVTLMLHITGGEIDNSYQGDALLLKDATGQEIAGDWSADQDYYLVRVWLHPGLYYIHLYKKSSTCSYEIWADLNIQMLDEIEPNNLPEQPTPLPPNANSEDDAALGILTAPVDKNDWWKFEVSESSEVYVWLKIVDGEPDNSYQGDALLLKEDGTWQEIAGDWSIEQSYYRVRVWLHPGMYFVHLYKKSGTCNYKLWVESAELTLDEEEPNNSSDQATPLPPGANNENYAALGILADPVDKDDWWKFMLNQSGEVDIWLKIVDGEVDNSYQGDALLLKDVNELEIDGDWSIEQSYYHMTVYLGQDTQYFIHLYKKSGSCIYKLWISGSSDEGLKITADNLALLQGFLEVAYSDHKLLWTYGQTLNVPSPSASWEREGSPGYFYTQHAQNNQYWGECVSFCAALCKLYISWSLVTEGTAVNMNSTTPGTVIYYWPNQPNPGDQHMAIFKGYVSGGFEVWDEHWYNGDGTVPFPGDGKGVVANHTIYYGDSGVLDGDEYYIVQYP